jgi:hypothetical protein
MTKSQELQLAMSRKRQRIGEILAIKNEDRNDDQRGELDTLTGELQTHESEFRAAVASEATETAEARAAAGEENRATETETTESPEDREVRSLQSKALFGRFMNAFAYGEPLSGPEKELSEHRGLDLAGRNIPWDMLLPPSGEEDPWARPPAGVMNEEHRADVVTPAPASGNPTNQAEILRRIFARSGVALVGVDMPIVAVGQASYPVLTTGQTAEFVGADAAKEATAGAITPNVLSPKRLSARFQYRLEDEATTRGLDAAFRRDLRAGMIDAMSGQIIGAGNANVRGFLATPTNGGLDAGVAPPATLVDFADAAKSLASGVDGIYAGSEAELVWLIGTKSYELLAAAFPGTGDRSAAERVRRMARGFMASAHLPDATGMIQDGILAKVGAVTRTAVAPIWEGIRILPADVSTAATTGRVNVTAIAFSNFAILRKAAFIRTRTRVAT